MSISYSISLERSQVLSAVIFIIRFLLKTRRTSLVRIIIEKCAAFPKQTRGYAHAKPTGFAGLVIQGGLLVDLRIMDY